MTFYGTSATAAGLVVPKRYVTQVGDEGFLKHPVGAGPYRFVSHRPGVEVVLEADPAYWRHPPYVKRMVMKSVPEGTTRVAMLKRGEVDIAYSLDGEDAETVRRDPRLALVRRGMPRRTGSICRSSGTRNRRGPTSGCVRLPISRWTARPSATWRVWASARPRRHRSSRDGTSPCRRPRPLMIPPGPGSSSPRPGIRRA
jgi:hypothetical protein